jgi:hypothetical protein
LIGVTEDSHCPVASGALAGFAARPTVDDDSILDDAVRRFISDIMDALTSGEACANPQAYGTEDVRSKERTAAVRPACGGQFIR